MTSPQQYTIFEKVQECFGSGPDVCWLVVNNEHPIGIYDTFQEAKQAQLLGHIFAVSYNKNVNPDSVEYHRIYTKSVNDLAEMCPTHTGNRIVNIGWISVVFFFIMKHERMLVDHQALHDVTRRKAIKFKSYIDKNSDKYSSNVITKMMPEFLNRIAPSLPRIPTHSYNLRSRK